MTSEIMDFSHGEQLKFRIDEDEFLALRDIPAAAMLEFMGKADGLNEDNMTMADIEQMVRLLLVPSSADRFVERLTDMDNPIGMTTLNKVLPWLMEEMGLRPTEPSEDSSDGSKKSPDVGMNSEVNVPSVASISSPYPPT